MLRSMWSGVSGLRTHQYQMDVIGNDIANVNTTGYKQSNVTFQDAFYQSLSAPSEGTPGREVGLGVSVGDISKDFREGILLDTGVATHMAISGKGFFVVKDQNGEQASYTRAGDFELSYDGDSSVRLLAGDGKYLYGTPGANSGTASTMIELPQDMQELIISPEGSVSYVNGSGSLVSDVYKIDIATFAGTTGLKQQGGNLYAESAASGSPIFTSTEYQVQQGYLENSNVDLAKEFTEMIVAERGFQANSRAITTSDSMLQELLNLKR